MSAQLIRDDMFKGITEVEEATCLLSSYVDLMFRANEFLPDDPEGCRRANAQIYALLLAVRAQVSRLKPVPSVLLNAFHE